MIDAGYDRRFAAGLLTASGLIDNMIPPSIAMILFAAVAEQSVVQTLHGRDRSRAFCSRSPLRPMSGSRATAARSTGPSRSAHAASPGKPATRSGRSGLPVLILGGIYSGAITATEAGGVSCVYAILVSAVIYREIKWPDLGELANARPTSRRR